MMAKAIQKIQIGRDRSGFTVIEMLISLLILGIVIAFFYSTYIDNIKLRRLNEVKASIATEIDPAIKTFLIHHLAGLLRTQNCSLSPDQLQFRTDMGSVDSITFQKWQGGPAFISGGEAGTVKDRCDASSLSPQGPGKRNLYYCTSVSHLSSLSRRPVAEQKRAYVHFNLRFFSPFRDRTPVNQVPCSFFRAPRSGPVMMEVYYTVYWLPSARDDNAVHYSNTLNISNI